MFTFKIYHQINQLENQWNSLLDSSGTANIFLNFYWVRNWLINYQEYIESLQIIVIFDNNKCISIAPLYISSYYKNTLALLGTNEPEYCEVQAEAMDIIYNQKYREELINFYIKTFEIQLSFDRIILKNISESSCIYNIAQKLTSKYLNKPTNACHQFIFDQFKNIESTLYVNKKNKRILNKFLKCESCHFEIPKTNKTKKNLFHALIELHQQRWKKKGKAGVFAEKRFINFHKSLLEDKNFNKKILLTAIKYGEKIISVNYSYINKKNIYFYQAGIDTLFKPNLSPGLLNHLLLINYGETIDIKAYNLLLSHDFTSYKAKLSNSTKQLITIELYRYNLKNIFKLISLKLNLANKLNKSKKHLKHFTNILIKKFIAFLKTTNQ